MVSTKFEFTGFELGIYQKKLHTITQINHKDNFFLSIEQLFCLILRTDIRCECANHTDRKADRQTHTHSHIHTHTDTHVHTHSQTDTDRHTHSNPPTHTYKYTHIQTHSNAHITHTLSSLSHTHTLTYTDTHARAQLSPSFSTLFLHTYWKQMRQM